MEEFENELLSIVENEFNIIYPIYSLLNIEHTTSKIKFHKNNDDCYIKHVIKMYRIEQFIIKYYFEHKKISKIEICKYIIYPDYMYNLYDIIYNIEEKICKIDYYVPEEYSRDVKFDITESCVKHINYNIEIITKYITEDTFKISYDF
uniref:Uncharacterized protein n=1 Tax=Pithovirus LCDPAC02 TaxID=2506601 RepID=A0A481YP26_9VIRU|nr:MAG: hypothetical protein LCDPAC02_02200 [Pithovirus LCDPAC02]